jgi:hypothetical protein
MLMFAQYVACRIMKPLQAAVGIASHDQLAIAIVIESFALLLFTQNGSTFNQTIH